MFRRSQRHNTLQILHLRHSRQPLIPAFLFFLSAFTFPASPAPQQCCTDATPVIYRRVPAVDAEIASIYRLFLTLSASFD